METTLNVSLMHLTDEQFYQLCQANRDLRLELSATGELSIMPPTGWGSGERNFDIIVQLGIWNRQTKLGKTFDSSTGFKLPNGADRSPDVAWVEKSRIEILNPDPNKFLPLAPDFLIELRSSTDNLATLQKKMQEYQNNGVKLGWLINPHDRQVEIYRLVGVSSPLEDRSVEVLQSPATLSGESILPGFELDLTTIW
jgi:Uma2 family endonuclease